MGYQMSLDVPLRTYRRRGSNSSKQLSLGDAGLQLHDATLSNLFGGEIIPRMKRVYENYLTQQMNFSYKYEISQLLTLTILLNNISPIINSKYSKTLDRFNGVNERVLSKLYGCKKEIAEVGGLFGRVGAKYLELFDNAQQ
ncbi:Hypothetical_protein [Hexamita inflata]|uniref:Hypothetical_protein n=1 Tax=Hexamita inflata TaxID=28002 RepID=A0AA86QL76_9EUKA|nr:Hypothetical protein HINF_LOCUS43988 [Hexamita inflata]